MRVETEIFETAVATNVLTDEGNLSVLTYPDGQMSFSCVRRRAGDSLTEAIVTITEDMGMYDSPATAFEIMRIAKGVSGLRD